MTEPHRQSLAQADLLLLCANMLAPTAPEARLETLEAAAAVAEALLADAGVEEAEALAILLRRMSALADAEASLAGWADEHTRLFEGGVACPVNETAYIRRDKGAILADIMGFYRAFGFTLRAGAPEKADHLAAELEYAALLLIKLAQAQESGHAEHEDVTRAALESFAGDHLSEWLPSFCEALARECRLEIFLHFASFLGAVWEGIAKLHRLPLPGASWEPIRDQGTPYECGMADAHTHALRSREHV